MNPAQLQLARQFIDWELIERRLSSYPAIRRAFDLTMLEGSSDKPPYYCHYMAWRLGTWGDESLFSRLEELLIQAESLPNWRYERPLLVSPEFADFWSLVWQLQVAEYLATIGSEVKWAKSGPDLSVVVGDERWFVECYTPRKSFGLFLFLEELLERVDPAVHVSYDFCLPFQLPHDSERADFLNTITEPFLNTSYIDDAKNAAMTEYPVRLYAHPESSLKVYVEGDNVDAYRPGIIPNRVGSPEEYLKITLQEAARAKRKSNALEGHRPNLVAVNYLLSADYQLAGSIRRFSDWAPGFRVPTAIDALAVSVIGINQRLTREALKILHGSHKDLSVIGELAVVA